MGESWSRGYKVNKAARITVAPRARSSSPLLVCRAFPASDCKIALSLSHSLVGSSSTSQNFYDLFFYLHYYCCCRYN